MKNTFIITSTCWLIILNSLIFTYMPGSSNLSTRNLITGATVVDPNFMSSLKHITFPLIVLNITTIFLLIFIYTRIKERKRLKFQI